MLKQSIFAMTLLSFVGFWVPAQSATLTTFTRFGGSCNDLNSSTSGVETSTCVGSVQGSGSQFDARAGFGNIGATGISRGGSSQGRASTSMTEVLTSGTSTGTLQLDYDIAGTIFENLPTFSGAGTFLINVNIGGSLVYEYYRAYNFDRNTGSTFLVESRNTGSLGTGSHTFNIVGGQTTVSAGITIDANCFSQSCEIGGNFFNSLLFVGGSITDSNGNVVNGGNLTSESGFNYLAKTDPHMAAVPLPGTAGLLMLALGLVGMGTRFRLS